MEEEIKKETEPDNTGCLTSCIHRNTPMCMQCANWSEYEWDYTDING